MNDGARLLVAGGTTESRRVANALMAEGYCVTVSQATETAFPFEPHARLNVRTGRLTLDGWEALVCERSAVAIIDAGHPYACDLRETLKRVSAKLSIPLLRFKRAVVELEKTAMVVESHAEAARRACALGQRILVTVGTRQLATYVLAATHTQVKLYARVLDNAESREVLTSIGLPPSQVLFGRGPFGLEQNLEHLRNCAADVLVTKDSGAEGGTREKLEAARQLGCCAIVVARPKEDASAVESVEALLERLRQMGL